MVHHLIYSGFLHMGKEKHSQYLKGSNNLQHMKDVYFLLLIIGGNYTRLQVLYMMRPLKNNFLKESLTLYRLKSY